ncbi:MAG TPA: IS30 family transposase [Candidatus Taylorbacteria bacterium]|nr:MAG: Transposase insI for insertion sequence element IS30B/C/D [Parcubacteria group bacterium GW2011_GWA2_47_64]KKU97190.1 MAG: Transposase insI for insertion sequence element IS30B/C/D [Parcubacteria group bacterium GW2011_GWC2_48_17]HBV01638.1 IS30 family transposase [Candidatus Taylorbacteria bacterium]
MKKDSIKKKRRNFSHFDLNERVQIEINYSRGKSLAQIAKILGKRRSKSSVSREIGGRPSKGLGRYKAYQANLKSLSRDKRRGRRERLKNETVRRYVIDKMKLGWSPEQISLRLPIDCRGETISYEAIYQFVYAQIRRGGSGKAKEGCEDLRRCLPRRRSRRSTKGARKAQKIERLESLPSIENRPSTADERKEVGHFEDDTIVSRQSAARIKSVNERVSGVVFLGWMRDGTSAESTRVICERLSSIPSPYLKTLTRDRGTENFGWEKIEGVLPLKVYFAHPYCSHERGSNENINGLVRRFFSKKTDFATVTEEEIRRVEYLLNTRPRKRFGGKTPLEVLLEKTGVAITY